MNPRVSVGAASSTSSIESLSDYFKAIKQGSLEAAERHRRASRVTQLRGIEVSTLPHDACCECCSFPIDAEQFPLTAVDSLAELGTAIPLYFHLNRQIALMLFVVSVVAAIPDTIEYSTLGNDFETPISQFCSTDHTELPPTWTTVLRLIAAILMCLGYIFIALRIKVLMINLDEGIETPSKFAVLLKNLGSDWNSEDLKKHIEENMQAGEQRISVVQIITCFDTTEFERIIKRIRRIKLNQEKHCELQSQPLSTVRRCWNALLPIGIPYTDSVSEQGIKTDIMHLDAEIEAIANQKWKKTGVAVVVMETNTQARAFVAKWLKSTVKQYLCCCVSANEKELNFNGRRMYVKKALEPNDILWKNLKHSRLKRVMAQTLAIGLMTVVLAINLICLYYIASQKNAIKIKEEACNNSDNGDDQDDFSDYNLKFEKAVVSRNPLLWNPFCKYKKSVFRILFVKSYGLIIHIFQAL